MWFRNLHLYTLTAPIDLNAEALDQSLRQGAFRPCGSLEAQTLGWAPPLGEAGQLLTHEAQKAIMICAQRQERLLPAAVVAEAVEEKVAEIQEQEGRQVRRKERLQLRDEMVHQLLPRAFTRTSRTYAYVDDQNGWILVDTASTKRAEEVLHLLRQTLGSLKVKPLRVKRPPADVMTSWLNASPPDDIELMDECELREPGEEGGVVRCRRQDLDGDEIQAHLDAGKQVTRLAFSWRERLSAVLGDDLVLRRIRFLDLLQEEVANAGDEDDVSRFDTEFSLMSLEFAAFIPPLLAAFGGLAEEDDHVG
jgi:recombination associated protein RdgC